ncbi:hypothetical protein I545_6950 [Mycobacterium kansasii 662]|uniref:Uncharacterized protein n=1 Tax=Mycobacterium kansasii 662 TaxID=1299326 RepID=X7XQJ7_MYCKA|nr:hypothetical protein I545_6950 [Mycobacterium kansasii 662]
MALTTFALGLVSVEPSANLTVGTVLLPPLTAATNSAAALVVFDVDLGVRDPLCLERRLEPETVATP